MVINTITYGYNANNQLTSASQTQTAGGYTIEFDKLGRLDTRTDPLGNRTRPF